MMNRYIVLAIVGFGLPAPSTWPAEIVFKSSVDYTTAPLGVNPVAITTADFNGDGWLDLATANADSGNVSVFRNLGNGTFVLAPGSFAAGTSPSCICTADFDGDGVADLAVGNKSSSNVSVLKGLGNCSFAAAANYAVGNLPVSICTGDFNGDGLPDLAVACANPRRVSILLNTGAGVFAAAIPVYAGSAGDLTSICSVDINSNDSLDLVITGYDGYVVPLVNTGDGSFRIEQKSQLGAGPTSICAADFNEDGMTDVAVVANLYEQVSVFKHVAIQPYFQSAYSGNMSAPVSIAAADFDGDKKCDLVVTLFSSWVNALQNRSNMYFSSASLTPVTGVSTAICIGDFNRDKKPDVATANSSGNSISILINDTHWVCCVGVTGNVDCDGLDGVDISDLSALIDNLYISFAPLCCAEEANTDGQPGIDISDLSALIDYLYISFTPPAACQ